MVAIKRGKAENKNQFRRKRNRGACSWTRPKGEEREEAEMTPGDLLENLKEEAR